MIIHTVKEGETLFSIGEMYGVSPLLLSQNNDVEPDSLVEGQDIVVQIPKITHTVKEGETLFSIATMYGVTAVNLLQNNPIIVKNGLIYPGETIVIEYDEEKSGVIAVNGYVYPYVNRNVLIRNLPYLSFVTIFTYGFTPDGELIGIDDEDIIRIATDYGVAPIMLISTLGENGAFSNELASLLLNNTEAQNVLIDNIIENMRAKGYKGLDIDFEYVFPEDKDNYVQFVSSLTQSLNAEGFFVMTALAPKTSSEQKGLLYEAHDYNALGAASNAVLIMTYEWGYTYGPPMAVAPINNVRRVVEYAVTQIPNDKIFMGIPFYGYDWTLPFVQGSKARSMGSVTAVNIARRTGSVIQYDEEAQTPFFEYTDDITGKDHIVWFENARSIQAKLGLIKEFGLIGTGIWNVMRYFPEGWLVINGMFDIYKAL
jgi:spore germination protein